MQEVIWSIIALLVVAVLIGVTAVILLPAVVEVLINGAIIYFIFLKASADIRKRKRLKIYLIAGIVALFLLALFGNMFPVWGITAWAILTIFFAMLMVIVSAKH